MYKYYRACILFLAYLVLLVPTARGADTTRIMPLGNSITEAQKGHTSYRCWLWEKLDSTGYTTDLVGSRSGVFNGHVGKQTASSCPCVGFDEDHEGHWGWEADEVLYGGTDWYGYPGTLGEWADSTRPDIALVHLGSNEMLRDSLVDYTYHRLAFIVDTLRAHNPDIAILMAQLIPAVHAKNDSITKLNSMIPSLVDSLNTGQSPVRVVDQNTGFDAVNDTYDGIHPDSSGEVKMALKWYNALVPILSHSLEITLTEPAPGTEYYPKDTITLAAQVTASDSVVRVEFFDGAYLLAVDSIAPYGYSWAGAGKGDLFLTGLVIDTLGDSAISETVQVSIGNVAPVANAGNDTTVDEQEGVTLYAGNSTDDNGDSLSFRWHQLSGPPVTLDDTTAVSPSFTAPILVDTLTVLFEVTVSDSTLSDKDTVQVTMNGEFENADFIYRRYPDAVSDSMPYRLFIPALYSPDTTWPIVLWLHGAAGRGTDNNQQIDEYDGSRVWAYAEHQAEHPCFIVAPQCPGGTRWEDMCPGHTDCWGNSIYIQEPERLQMTLALNILDSLRREFYIDSMRIYVAGQSMGGYGAWGMATRYPGLFAAALPAAGGVDTTLADSLLQLGVWAFHGGADSLVPPHGFRAVRQRLPYLGGRGRFTEYDGQAHDIWSLCWNEEELIEWTFAQVKGDTTKPSAPGELAAVRASATSFILTWPSAYDNESGIASYEIYRDGIHIGFTRDTSFTDSGIDADSNYSYSVSAVNGSAREGPAVSGAVPVVLSSFTGAVVGSSVLLTWTTETEKDNLGFNVLRSRKKDSGFEKVNPYLIQGQGTISLPSHYTYNDYISQIGDYYYKLEQVDLIGNRHYSDVIFITVGGTGLSWFSCPDNRVRISIENPARTIRISIFNKIKDKLGVYLYDLQGGLIKILAEDISRGGECLEFEENIIKEGMYIIEVKGNNIRLIRKTLVIH